MLFSSVVDLGYCSPSAEILHFPLLCGWFILSAGFELLIEAAISSEKPHLIDYLEGQTFGFIPTNNSAPGPDPPIVSTLKSFKQLYEFADMIRDEFGMYLAFFFFSFVAEFPKGILIRDGIVHPVCSVFLVPCTSALWLLQQCFKGTFNDRPGEILKNTPKLSFKCPFNTWT